MFYFAPVLTIFLAFYLEYVDNASISNWQKHLCAELPSMTLENILGGAFNPRYMSIDQPTERKSLTGGKRGVSFDEDFYVEDNFIDEVDSEPAWEVTNHVKATKMKYGLHRRRRSVDYLQQWHCKSKIQWTDLGPDYFPRYLRSVVCLSKNCWFGIYKCKPRSFTVKLLRRKQGLCVKDAPNDYKIGLNGLPKELKEMWVWEERAVNFCCDCTRV